MSAAYPDGSDPCKWSQLLTGASVAEILAQVHDASASSCAWWKTRTDGQLMNLAWGAWEANDPDTYQMARSLLALRGVHYAR